MPVAQLTEFLGSHAPSRFCAACLAFEVQASLSDVRSAIRTIASQIALAQDADVCATCGRETIVFGVVLVDARAPDEVIAGFFHDGEHSATCHACLARAVKLPVEAIQKGVSRLKLDRRARVQAGQCGVCGHARVVVMPTQLLR